MVIRFGILDTLIGLGMILSILFLYTLVCLILAGIIEDNWE